MLKNLMLKGDHKSLIEYQRLGAAAQYAIPTPEHYYPLLYTLGLQDNKDVATIFNDKAVLGSITMTSVRLG